MADDEFDGLVLTALVVLATTIFVVGGLVAVVKERSKASRRRSAATPDCFVSEML